MAKIRKFEITEHLKDSRSIVGYLHACLEEGDQTLFLEALGEVFEAIVAYDPDIKMLRGEFVGLNGGADFYANDIASLAGEGAESLRALLDIFRQRGIDPYRHS